MNNNPSPPTEAHAPEWWYSQSERQSDEDAMRQAALLYARRFNCPPPAKAGKRYVGQTPMWTYPLPMQQLTML